MEMQGDGRGRSQKKREGGGAKTSEEELEAIKAKTEGGGGGEEEEEEEDRISVSFWERAEGIETGGAGGVGNSAGRKKPIWGNRRWVSEGERRASVGRGPGVLHLRSRVLTCKSGGRG